jgi:hypothetical protein
MQLLQVTALCLLSSALLMWRSALFVLGLSGDSLSPGLERGTGCGSTWEVGRTQCSEQKSGQLLEVHVPVELSWIQLDIAERSYVLHREQAQVAGSTPVTGDTQHGEQPSATLQCVCKPATAVCL